VSDVAVGVNVNVSMSDVVDVYDSVSLYRTFNLPLLLQPYRPRVRYVTVQVGDAVTVSDSASLYKTFNLPLLLRPYRPRIRYVTVQATDVVSVSDVAAVYKVPVVSMADIANVADSVSLYRTFNLPLLLQPYRPRVRYVTVQISDVVSVVDTMTPYKVPVVSATDVVSITDAATVYKVPTVYTTDVINISDSAVGRNVNMQAGDVVDVVDGVVVCKKSDSTIVCDVHAECVCNVNIVGVSV